MKNNKLFQRYLIIWLIVLITFNVVVFGVPTLVFGSSNQSGGFWVAYILITLAFFGHLACICFLKKSKNLTNLFYNLPILTISSTGLFLMLIIGSLFMIIPDLPVWIGVILCFIVLTITSIVVIKANIAAEIVENKDQQMQRQTSIMKELTMKAENLIMQAKSEDVQRKCQKIYEAFRYSDPVSNENLNLLESEIYTDFMNFSDAVQQGDEKNIDNNVNRLLVKIQERNLICARGK